MLQEANWRNEVPAIAEEPAPFNRNRAVGPGASPGRRANCEHPAGLVNWRNRPDESRPLPLVAPPPPPGTEFTVAAMMPTFGWE